jgi:hypothetical protein
MVWQYGKRGLMQHYYALGAVSLGIAGATLYVVGGQARKLFSSPKPDPN